jgi:hypothetical protein
VDIVLENALVHDVLSVELITRGERVTHRGNFCLLILSVYWKIVLDSGLDVGMFVKVR